MNTIYKQNRFQLMSSDVYVTLSDTYDPELVAPAICTEETITLEYHNITFTPSSHQHDSCPSSSNISLVYQNVMIIPIHVRYHMPNERGYENIYINKPRLYLSTYSAESTSSSECIIPSDTSYNNSIFETYTNQSCPSSLSLIADVCTYPIILALIEPANPYNSYNCTDTLTIRVPVGYIHHKVYVSCINAIVIYTATILIILVIAYKRR